MSLPEPALSRPVTVLSLGARIGIWIAAGLLLLGVYQLILPIHIPADQGVFGCGSGINPPVEGFQQGFCQKLAVVQQMKAALAGALALVFAVGGYLVFGATRVDRPAHRRRSDPREIDPAE